MTDQVGKVMTFVESVLVRPRMYTLDGTFPEIVAFITGYMGGLAKSNLSAPMVTEWSGFCNWLGLHLGVTQAKVFDTLRSSGNQPDEHIALLLSLFRQYLNEASTDLPE